MKFIKILILISFISFLYSCGSLKEGFINQKKNSSDEFLVEKKSPLVMPPNYSELPMPKTDKSQILIEENKIQELLDNNENEAMKSQNRNQESTSFEQSLLNKIKKK